MLISSDALPVAEGAQHGLVRCVLRGTSAAEGFAHAVHERAVLVRDGGNDARNQVVLELENRVLVESALVVLGPEMGAGNRIHELHRQAQFGARLPDATL